MPSSQTAVQKEGPQHHFHPTVTPLEKEGSGRVARRCCGTGMCSHVPTSAGAATNHHPGSPQQPGPGMRAHRENPVITKLRQCTASFCRRGKRSFGLRPALPHTVSSRILLDTFFFFLTNGRFVSILHPARLTASFPTALVHSVSLCHILVILTILEIFSLLYL